DLDCNGHQRLGFRVTPGRARLYAADVDLVDFHDSLEPLTIGTYHGAAKLVEPRPSGFVAPEPEHALHVHGVRAVLVAHDLPGRDEPQPKWLARPLEDRAGGNRRSAPAAPAQQPPGRLPGLPLVPATRAHEPSRPPDARQEALTGLVIRKEPVEVRQVPRVVLARPEPGRVSRGHTTRYSGRWLEANT